MPFSMLLFLIGLCATSFASGILVTRASYVCPDGRSCDPTAFVRGKCDHRQSCTMSAGGHICGDPCYGTAKTLTIEYRCGSRIGAPVSCRDGASCSPECPSDYYLGNLGTRSSAAAGLAHRHLPFEEFLKMSVPAGMESMRIPSSAITSSSDYNPKHRAELARLNDGKGPFPRDAQSHAWCGKRNGQSTQDWLQIDLSQAEIVTGVGIQGRGDHPQWVTSFEIRHSLDGEDWTPYREPIVQEQLVLLDADSPVKLFKGNTDSETVVRHDLQLPFFARYVRYYVKTFHVHPSMRAELYIVNESLREEVMRRIRFWSMYGIASFLEGNKEELSSRVEFLVDKITGQDGLSDFLLKVSYGDGETTEFPLLKSLVSSAFVVTPEGTLPDSAVAVLDDVSKLSLSAEDLLSFFFSAADDTFVDELVVTSPDAVIDLYLILRAANLRRHAWFLCERIRAASFSSSQASSDGSVDPLHAFLFFRAVYTRLVLPNSKSQEEDGVSDENFAADFLSEASKIRPSEESQFDEDWCLLCRAAWGLLLRGKEEIRTAPRIQAWLSKMHLFALLDIPPSNLRTHPEVTPIIESAVELRSPLDLFAERMKTCSDGLSLGLPVEPTIGLRSASEDGVVPAHAEALILSYDFFKTGVLEESLSGEKNNREVVIKGLSSVALELLVRFSYIGSLGSSEVVETVAHLTHLLCLFKHAKKTGAKSLAVASLHHLRNIDTSADNFLEQLGQCGDALEDLPAKPELVAAWVAQGHHAAESLWGAMEGARQEALRRLSEEVQELRRMVEKLMEKGQQCT